ncbi:aspartic proteinase CDR1-like [Hordeum vulgare subsp. vulgare]|uniref:Peptidase A1 domain-containing protein n=1 Tax=Hordeum vulgare subsp. vulgare TaxID=112509 RepID=A0A8I6XK87_HORVV|nr:aspartic proteinase CDR1-like [Hordeum vulgare subsp. vulgare]
MPTTTTSRALVGVVLMAHVFLCTAYVGGDGFSVEFIHRDSVMSPYRDPSLSAHARVLEAVRRSTLRAAALSRSYARADAPSADGAVSELTSRPFEYLMAVNVGTPPTRMLAIADTGSDLVWLNCSNGAGDPGLAAARHAHAHAPAPAPAPVSAPPPGVQFNSANSTTFGLVSCGTAACRALPEASCADSKYRYLYSYGDGSQTSGLLSTETFTFADDQGTRGGDRTMRVANVNFGCSTTMIGSFIGDGLVGLGGGDLSLVNQLGADTSLGRRFSYCLVPYSINASSVLNFGPRAAVTEPGAATTPLIPSEVKAYYTVDLRSVKIGNKTLAAPQQSTVIVDSGTTLTYLAKELVDPLVKELTRRVKLPRVPSPEELLPLCFDVSGAREEQVAAMIPDVTLELGGGAAVTLKTENTFLEVQEGTLCLAVVVPSGQFPPMSIIGNIAQQNMHVGYDLDKGTVTFAAADCAAAPSPSPSPSGSLYI